MEEAGPDIVTMRVFTQLRQGGNMRQRAQRTMIARKKINHRKATERQKLSEKQDQQMARIRTESKA